MTPQTSALGSLLLSQRVIVLDGATGTELERRGVAINDSKLWSAKLLLTDEGRGALQDVHAAYYEAGADICTTATYQANLTGFLDEGVSPADVGPLFVQGVELCDAARRAFWARECGRREEEADSASAPRRRPLVAYSCGAYGASLADGSEFTGRPKNAHVLSQAVLKVGDYLRKTQETTRTR